MCREVRHLFPITLLSVLVAVACGDGTTPPLDAGPNGAADVGPAPDAATADASARDAGAGCEGPCDVEQISAGGGHTCALRGTGTVFCWGANAYGQLGDGTTMDHPSPVAVAELTNAVEVDTGSAHTCARLSSGAVRCWGWNFFGQLGDGSTTHSSVPVEVVGLDDALEIDASGLHTCARRATGHVVCWGQGVNLQLGDGTMMDRPIPGAAVSGLDDAVDVDSLEYHGCARRASGAVVCWGKGDFGQLGDGDVSDRVAPVPVMGLFDAVSIATSGRHTCAVRATGAAVCWGHNHLWGMLGDGTELDRPRLGPVSDVTDAVEVSSGSSHTCVRRRSGGISCWGLNNEGEIGDGTLDDPSGPTPLILVPRAVRDLDDAVAISAGTDHTCARRADGSAWCWGSNATGQLGDGTVSPSRPLPARVSFPPP